MKRLRAFIDFWGNGPRSWAGHAIVAALLTLVFRPETAIVAYLFREGAEIYYGGLGTTSERVDHVMDFCSPALAAMLVWWIRT